jgi:HEAT repeat protein
VLLLLVGFSFAPRAAAVTAAPRPPAPSIEELIRRLGDDDFEVREAASRALEAAGRAAAAALEEAARDSQDAEIRWRAQRALDKIAKHSTPTQGFAWRVMDATEMLAEDASGPSRAEVVALAVKAMYSNDERSLSPQLAHKLQGVRSMTRAELQLLLWSAAAATGPRSHFDGNIELDG